MRIRYIISALLLLLSSGSFANSDILPPEPLAYASPTESLGRGFRVVPSLEYTPPSAPASSRLRWLEPNSAADPSPSSGCKRATPAVQDSLEVAGRTRHFLSHIPEDYQPGTPYQLIIAFHGRTGSNAEVQQYFALEDYADSSIILYPSGLPNPDVPGTRTWSDPGDPGDALRDYALFDALVSYAREAYCIDETRVFAVGHSLGASFVNSLACARAEVLRGVASLAGGVYSSRSIEAGCSQDIAMMLMHNPHDAHVPIAMGEQVLTLYREQRQGSEIAAVQGMPPTLEEALPSYLRCQNYADASAPLLWCPHQQDYVWNGRYYPHGWMQGMGEAVMTFFAGLP